MTTIYLSKPTARRTITMDAEAVQIIGECTNGMAKHVARPPYEYE